MLLLFLLLLFVFFMLVILLDDRISDKGVASISLTPVKRTHPRLSDFPTCKIKLRGLVGNSGTSIWRRGHSSLGRSLLRETVCLIRLSASRWVPSLKIRLFLRSWSWILPRYTGNGALVKVSKISNKRHSSNPIFLAFISLKFAHFKLIPQKQRYFSIMVLWILTFSSDLF